MFPPRKRAIAGSPAGACDQGNRTGALCPWGYRPPIRPCRHQAPDGGLLPEGADVETAGNAASTRGPHPSGEICAGQPSLPDPARASGI